MTAVSGFPPIARADARVLVLGSMPGVMSLQKQQYYAHNRNSFWFIIEHLFSDQQMLDYDQRVRLLQTNRIALWDVLQHCVRPGSLDTSIENSSIITNNFNTFFKQHPNINAIFFNGARAQQEYNRRVVSELGAEFKDLITARLPSTSPAMASLRPEQKLEAWRVLKDAL